MNDYVDAGASFFVVSAAGRWTSQSVLDYHRMQQSTANRWAHRATQCALALATKTAPATDSRANDHMITDGAACLPTNKPVSRIAQPHAAIQAVTDSIDWNLVRSDPPKVGSTERTLDGWVVRLEAPA
jgi:hypothetical protein